MIDHTRPALLLALLGLTAAAVRAQVLQQTSNACTGGSVTLQVTGAAPGGPLALGIGTGLMDPPVVLPFGSLYLSLAPPPLDVLVFVAIPPATGAGTQTVNLPVPNAPTLAGAMLYLQVVDGTPALSNPTALWIGPGTPLLSPAPQLFGTGGWAVAVGDFIGSPALDVAVGAHGETVGPVGGAGRVHVFEGPAFANVVTLSAPIAEAGANFGRALVAADFDGDGNTDLAVGEPLRDSGAVGPDTGQVFVFGHPVGAGASWLLTPPASILGETLGDSLAAGDLDGDGRDEIVAGAPHATGAGAGNRRVVWFSNTGAAVFAMSAGDPLAAGATFGQSVAVGDTDADGALEIWVGDPGWTGAQGAVYRFASGGAPLGGITNPAPAAGSNFGQSITIGDLDGDGFGDALVGTPGQNQAWVFAGPALQNPQPLPTVSAGSSSGGRAVLVADVNGDGALDAVSGAPVGTVAGGESISFYLGPSLQARGVMTACGVGSAMGTGWSLAAGDLDGNGATDVVAGAPSSNPGFLPGAGLALILW